MNSEKDYPAGYNIALSVSTFEAQTKLRECRLRGFRPENAEN